MAATSTTIANEKRIASYNEFWPYYLREHSKVMTRRLHIFGTFCGAAIGIPAIKSGKSVVVFSSICFAYVCAWFSHFFVERNRPATFKYPLWSFRSDFKMVGHWLTNTLDAELERAGVRLN